MLQPPNFSEGGNVAGSHPVALVVEILRLNTTEGLEPGRKLFGRNHLKGHTVCFEVLAVDHERREIKVVEFPTYATFERRLRQHPPEF